MHLVQGIFASVMRTTRRNASAASSKTGELGMRPGEWTRPGEEGGGDVKLTGTAMNSTPRGRAYVALEG